MVYVPILKIDLPEPRLQELIPSTINVLLGACTLAYDAVYDLLHPLPPEGQEALYEAVITSLPREFRKARRRIVDLDIRDEDKVSEELETAAFNFYRRKMREEVCGYSDEETEDVTFRRLMSPDSAGRDIHGPTALDSAVLEQDYPRLQQLLAASPCSPVYQALQLQQQQEAAAVAALPSRARRVTVTTAVGGAGLALGAGVVRLVHLVSSRLAKQKRKAKRRAAAAGQHAGSRRQSEQGSTGGRGSSSRRSGTTGTGGGRVTPRSQR